MDVLWLRRHGISAFGYDPGIRGLAARPPGVGIYSVVSMIYVLNVLLPAARGAAIRKAATAVAPGGVLLVACRSLMEVTAEAHRCRWRAAQDGYVTSFSRRTFQAGFSAESLQFVLRASLGDAYSVQAGERSFSWAEVRRAG
jgi:hypothetical protein